MAGILIVDDHPLMRKGLALTLEEETDLRVIGEAASAEEALKLVDEIEPDLVIADVSLPGMSGLELVKHLHAVQPKLPILVVSRHDEALYAERAIRAGSRGYIMKLEADEVIVLTDPHYVEEFFHRDWASRARHKVGVPVLKLFSHSKA